MMRSFFIASVLSTAVSAYTWKNVKIGGGGGFIPGIVFNPTKEGTAYARADIGGLYKLNSDDSWTPLLDFTNNTSWHDWGVDAVATDPVNPSNVYIAVGEYTNSWDPNDGSILRSSNNGASWSETVLPFKVGGNMPGRGVGERLVVDPNNSNILYFGARSGHGLWKSVDKGVTWANVTSFTAVGTFQADPTDTTGYNNDILGITCVTFDPSSSLISGATSRIFVGSANVGSNSIYVSEDAGSTWAAVSGQPTGVFPHKCKLSTDEETIYFSTSNTGGPYDAGDGSVLKYSISAKTWTDITPAWASNNGLTMGYGGLALDAQNPGTIMVAACNLWYPDVQIFRSNDSGATWSTIWDYVNGITLYYTYDTDLAPWINASRQADDSKVLGWMIESLEIDPFDSDHWLYGTGLTIYGGHDLTSWPNVHVSSLADGVEETAVLALISPPGGAPLLSGVGDVGGFVHKDLDTSPSDSFETPYLGTTPGLDYAGLVPDDIVRTGNDDTTAGQLATSTDGGTTWTASSLATTGLSGGSVAISADGKKIVWVTANEGTYLFSSGSSTAVSSLPVGAIVASDKANASYFYGAYSNSFYVSSNGGTTFTASTIPGSGAVKIVAHPTIAGDIWLSTTSGLYHSTNFGSTFTTISGVTESHAIALGLGSGSYLNIYAFLSLGDQVELRVSADKGATWTVIQDSTHGFGSAGSTVLGASLDTEGLVFVGTNGRGIFYGLP